MSKESSSLSVFDLDDIPPTPTGFFPQIPVVSFSNFAGFDSKSSLSADVEASKFELRSPNPLPATTASYFYQPCADFIQPNSKRDSTAIPPAKDVFGPEKRLDVSEEEQHLRWVSERNNYPREETDPTCFPGLNSTEGIRHHGIGPDAGRLRPSEEESTKSYDEGVSEGYPKVYLENLEVYAAKDTPWTEAEATSSIFECQVGESSDPEWWSEASSPDSAKAASLSELLPFAKEAASLLFEKFLTQRFGTSWRTRGGTQDSSQSSVASGFSNTTTVSSVSSRSTSGKGTESLSRTSRKRPSDDEDDRRPTQRRRVELISRDFKGQLLACPFAKNKPLKHAKCFKYIIQEIARLK